MPNRFHKLSKRPDYVNPVCLALESRCPANARINFP